MKGLLARRQESATDASQDTSIAGSATSSVSRSSPRCEPGPVGTEADVGELYRANVDRVARWVARLGGPLIDVEDAVQEVFLVAERRRPTLEGPARLTTWLYRVTVKVVSHRRRKERIRRWLTGTGEEAAAQRPSDEPSPVEALEARERTALVYRVLDRLPEKQRAMIVLFELEGLPGEQIAELYGAKVATVWVWLHRARAAFLARLAEDETDRRTQAARAAESRWAPPAGRGGRA